jgi:hypothetical protein
MVVALLLGQQASFMKDSTMKTKSTDSENLPITMDHIIKEIGFSVNAMVMAPSSMSTDRLQEVNGARMSWLNQNDFYNFYNLFYLRTKWK